MYWLLFIVYCSYLVYVLALPPGIDQLLNSQHGIRAQVRVRLSSPHVALRAAPPPPLPAGALRSKSSLLPLPLLALPPLCFFLLAAPAHPRHLSVLLPAATDSRPRHRPPRRRLGRRSSDRLRTDPAIAGLRRPCACLPSAWLAAGSIPIQIGRVL